MQCVHEDSRVPCEGDVELEVNPYEEDVNNDTVFVYICRRHLKEISEDI